MAIHINVIGRLGMDSEIRESKNGSKYVTLRLATDEFRNGKNETAWLNIYDYSERGLKMAQYWKKGTMLQVLGTETVSVYQSKNGEYLASRDIRAYSVEFVNGGGNSTQAAETAAPTTTETATVASAPTTGTFTPPKSAAPSFSTPVSNADADDLPF